MKKFAVLVLALALLLGSSGCGSSEYTVSTKADGQMISILFVGDTHSGTITAENGDVYSFVDSLGQTSINYEITYPDGEVYLVGSSGVGHVSMEYKVDERYIATSELYSAIKSAQESAERRSGDSASVEWGVIFGAILVIGLGVFWVVRPDLVWKLRGGWMYANAEPSETFFKFCFGSGLILVILGIIAIFYAF